MTLREFWATETVKLQNTSSTSPPPNVSFATPASGMSLFQVNIAIISKQIFSSGVAFGSNGERNLKGFYDKRYWDTMGAVSLKLKTGIKPSTAIYSILNNTSGNQTLDCAQYVEMVRLGATLKTDGEKAFDERFKNELILRSHGSTGSETAISCERPNLNTLDTTQYFAINNDPAKIIFDSEEQLLTQAPIGSRVSVTNFNLGNILKSDSGASTQLKNLALEIRKKGWENENMLKIGNNEYAAFGIGAKVSLITVKDTLLKIQIKELKSPPNEHNTILSKIGVSQIEIFKRN